jgi:LysM repeat protein
MNRKYVLKNKSRFIVFISLLILLFCTILFTANVYSAKEKSSKLVVVKQGDTLWDIANRNINEYQDIRQYIYEIKKLNRLDNCEIYPGNELKVPIEQ